MLRVISGRYKNSKILEPDLKITRPTSEKIREAIFDSIQFKIAGTTVLDAFSGSGAFALEFLSRNAQDIYAVELNKKVYKTLSQNVERIDLDKQISLLNSDALLYLQNASNKKFDFIFLDPPYEKIELLNQILEVIVKNNQLNEKGQIIIETNNPEGIKIPQALSTIKNKKYGKTFILFLSLVND